MFLHYAFNIKLIAFKARFNEGCFTNEFIKDEEMGLAF